MRITMFILVACTLVGMSMLAVSTPIVDLKTDYYQVNGKTPSEIRDDLDMKTPIREDGLNYDAHTDWFVKWNFWWNKSNGQCAIKKVTTRVDIQYILPKLIISRALPKSLKQQWEVYMKALLHHEDGHKNIGVRAANEIEKEIGNMMARRTCKQLETDANRLGHKIIENFHGLDKEFDRKTDHGVKDGAIFP